MSEVKKFTNGSKNPIRAARTISHNILFARNNPDYFYPDGIWVFCGPQGSGKTLSAVQCLKKMLEEYPNALVCSNLDIRGLDREIIPFTDYKQLEELKNGINGVIFLLDEIHVIWNSLESKDIPISEMACFCQMRKDRRVIIGTSQVYSRIAKPIREQLKYIIDCHNIFGLLQWNFILDPTEFSDNNGKVEAKVLGRNFWFHSPDLYKSYDTLFKVNRLERKVEKNYGRFSRSNNV